MGEQQSTMDNSHMSNEPTPTEPKNTEPENTGPQNTGTSEAAGQAEQAEQAEQATTDIFDNVTDTSLDDAAESAAEEVADAVTQEMTDQVDDTADHTAEFSTDAGSAGASGGGAGGGIDGGSGGSGGYVPPQPPPPATAAPVRRLVRDPYSRLGGVASGISHHYGIDVSLVRLAFIVGTIFSGVGLILYLLAWLIIPRADYWPPVPASMATGQSSSIEGRELALGLLGLGVLIAVFTGGGGATRMLVSVGLVGAGIWLLTQPARSNGSGGSTPANPVAPQPPAQPAQPVQPDVPSSWQPASAGSAETINGPDDDVVSGYAGATPTASAAVAGAPTATYPATQTVYMPAAVPPRRRRIWPIFLILALIFIPVLFVVGAIGLLIGFSGGEFNGDFDARSMTVRPAEVADIPESITLGAGEVVVDLTNLDIADFSDLEAPHTLDIDLNAGEVVVELPEDLPVAVDANAGAGDVRVFDSYRDGIRPDIEITEDDAVLDLDIRVGVGEIRVRR